MKIDLQQKTAALQGSIEHYWFENETTGLKKTLFHRISQHLMKGDFHYSRLQLNHKENLLDLQ